MANGSIKEHLANYPAARAFVEVPKPFPESFATEGYFGVNAFKLVNADKKGTFIRYRIVPRRGLSHLESEQVKDLGPGYLFDRVTDLFKGEPTFDLVAQIAEDGDVTDDCTVRWPDTRKLVTLGAITFDGVRGDNTAEQKRIIFDPVPRVQGVEPSADPLIDVRAALYLISGRERRAA